jgi:hypothetical protein
MSLNAIAIPAAREPGPLVTRWRNLTVAKVDSIGFVVLRCPVLGRVVVEGEQHIEVVGDLRGRLGPLHTIVGGERLRSCDRQGLVLGLIDFGESLLRVWVCRLRQRGKNIRDLVKPATRLGSVGKHVAHRFPKAQRAVAHGRTGARMLLSKRCSLFDGPARASRAKTVWLSKK